MMPKSKVVLAAAIIVVTTIAAAAKDGNFPSIDIQKRCRDRAKSIDTMMGDKLATSGTFDSCMRSEQEARAALVAAWKNIPSRYRALCIQPNVFSPSYVEWIACLEMNIDVKNLRSKN